MILGEGSLGAIRHESLALKGVWRLVAFGKTVSHTPSPGNISTDTRFLVKLRNLELPQSQVREVPVGELPLLYHEAVLIDGRISLDKRFQANLREGRESLDFAPSNLKIFRRLATENGQLIIPPGRNAAPPANDDFNGYFLAVGQDNDPYSIIIPAAEVLRFFYATSDNFIKSLFDGRILAPNNSLFYNEYLDEHGTGSMILRKCTKDTDAIFLSLFAFNTYALQQAKRLHLNWSSMCALGQPAFVAAYPPINVEAETIFLYRQIESSGRTRKLITRILSCSFPPPCKQLLTARETDPIGTAMPQSDSSSSGKTEAPSNTPPETLADRPPTGDASNSIHDPDINSRFPSLMQIVVSSKNRDIIEGHISKAKPRLRPSSTSPVGSVISGKGSGDAVARTSISGTRESELPEHPRQFTDIDASPNVGAHAAVIKRLIWIELFTSATISYRIALSHISNLDKIPVNVFPPEIDGKKKVWLYTSNEKKHRRFAIVAEVRYQGRYRYLLEIQQPPDKPQYSTIVFWNDQELSVNNSDIKSLLLSCAIESRATLISGKCPHVQWGRLNHTQAPKGESEEQIALGYLERIMRASPITPNGRATRQGMTKARRYL